MFNIQWQGGQLLKSVPSTYVQFWKRAPWHLNSGPHLQCPPYAPRLPNSHTDIDLPLLNTCRVHQRPQAAWVGQTGICVKVICLTFLVGYQERICEPRKLGHFM